MSEISFSGIPAPLINYIYLIKNRESPYVDLARLLLKEMEKHYYNAQKKGMSETVFTISPRTLTDEIELLVQKNEKLTSINVCRTILALCHGSKLREEKDFYTTTTSGGKKNYHIKVSSKTISAFSKMLL